MYAKRGQRTKEQMEICLAAGWSRTDKVAEEAEALAKLEAEEAAEIKALAEKEAEELAALEKADDADADDAGAGGTDAPSAPKKIKTKTLKKK